MSRDLVLDSAKDTPYFFLSYERSQRFGTGDSPTVDYWVNRFFVDLCDRVRARISAPAEVPVGFMDQELLSRGGWPDRLHRALATCGVFVPLYSRSYFASEHCGREWSAFARRFHGRPEAVQKLIIPIVWTPVDQGTLPSVAQPVPCDDASVEAYAEHGCYGIMKISRYRGDYARMLDHFAARIVDAGENAPSADGPVPPYIRPESAFGAGTLGERPLRITIAAPSAGDLPAGRDSSPYGPDAVDWAPYWLESSRALAVWISDLAYSLGYQPLVADFQERGPDLLSGERSSAPELLVVDPWAALQDKSRDLLKRLDAMDMPWVQVVIPWNPQDAASAEAETKLRAAVEETLPRKLAEGKATSTLAVRGVPTLEDLAYVLPTVIERTVREYRKHAPPRPPTAEVVERPRLSLSRQELSGGE